MLYALTYSQRLSMFTQPSIIIQAPRLNLSLMEQAAATANANQLVLLGAHGGLLYDIDTTSISDIQQWAKNNLIAVSYTHLTLPTTPYV